VNQLKSDLYQLVNQRTLIVIGWTLALLYALFVLLSVTRTALAMGAWVGDQGGQPIAVGFMGFVYADPEQPRFWEVAYTATSFAGLVWVVFLILATMFVSSEVTSGTIRLAVAHGTGLFQIFLSKWTVVAVTTVLISVAFDAATFVTSCVITGFTPSASQVAAWAGLVGLQTLVMIVLTLMCVTMFVVTRSVVAVMGIVPIFMFAAVFLYATTAQDRPPAAQAFMSVNPMYYLTEASRYWVDADVVGQVLLFAAVGLPALLGLSWLILSRRDLT
jgi:ABC-type transport system involved in multi-copper enzyme maturation permease subunit